MRPSRSSGAGSPGGGMVFGALMMRCGGVAWSYDGGAGGGQEGYKRGRVVGCRYFQLLRWQAGLKKRQKTMRQRYQICRLQMEQLHHKPSAGRNEHEGQRVKLAPHHMLKSQEACTCTPYLPVYLYSGLQRATVGYSGLQHTSTSYRGLLGQAACLASCRSVEPLLQALYFRAGMEKNMAGSHAAIIERDLLEALIMHSSQYHQQVFIYCKLCTTVVAQLLGNFNSQPKARPKPCYSRPAAAEGVNQRRFNPLVTSTGGLHVADLRFLYSLFLSVLSCHCPSTFPHSLVAAA